MSGFKDGGAAEAVEWSAARSLLLNNPELVRTDEKLLQALGLKPAASNVIEFGPAALARLEAAKARETAMREEIEALAQANFAAQAETHACVVDLLESISHADLALRLNESVRARFGLESAAIVLEGPAPTGWRSLHGGFLDLVLGPDQVFAVGPCTGGREIFGEAAERVKSVAVARISVFKPERLGAVAFGSADADGYTADMGLELIAFLGRVVERTAERWPFRG